MFGEISEYDADAPPSGVAQHPLPNRPDIEAQKKLQLQ